MYVGACVTALAWTPRLLRCGRLTGLVLGTLLRLDLGDGSKRGACDGEVDGLKEGELANAGCALGRADGDKGSVTLAEGARVGRLLGGMAVGLFVFNTEAVGSPLGFAVGERVVVTSTAYRKDSFEAKVSRIGAQVDQARGTVEVVVVALHPPLWIRPGLSLG